MVEVILKENGRCYILKLKICPNCRSENMELRRHINLFVCNCCGSIFDFHGKDVSLNELIRNLSGANSKNDTGYR